MISHVAEFVPMANGHATAGLLFVQERLDEQRGGQNLVARTVLQVGARHVGGTYRLALAAAQAVFDGVGNGTDVGLLQDQRLGPHEAEARRIGMAQVATFKQLAFIEATLRVDALFIVAKRLDFLGLEELELGDADAVFAGNHTVQ